MPKTKIQTMINAFLSKKIIDKYPILIEKSREPVAQEEHTIVLDMDGNKFVTTRE
jgi:methionine aminopeptidase